MTRKPLNIPSTPAALKGRRLFKPSRLALLLANALLVPAAGQAQSTLPTGMNVVSGQASASQSGKQLTITNSANAILNWQSFSIGAGNTVQFNQPGATSQVLNRVTGNDPSTLLGSLTSNGKVWLLNPNGVLFGQGARVDVGSLVVSTLDLSNESWLAGQYHFTAASGTPAAAIANQGELRGSLGGHVVLIGGSVTNEGVIDAPGGQVMLAAGQSVDLVDTGAPNLSVHVNAVSGDVLNLGQLSSDGGHIDVYGNAVNQQGIVRADSIGTGAGGSVVLAASGQLTLAGGSRTSADSAAATAGQVQLTGTRVALQDGSAVSASGANGGGTVLVGGGAQGQDAAVSNAQAVFFARGASISADALSTGDGGHIVLWSDDATRAYGSLSAHGGASGGNGGLIETSGGWLDARPLALDVGAPHGAAGEWLLDPYDVTISDSTSDSNFDSSFNATGDATISSNTLVLALNAGTNVTVQTGGSAGTSAGNITIASADIVTTAAAPGSLTLVADHDIEMDNSTIESRGGAMPVTFLAGRSGLGSIVLDNSTISTAGGAIFLGGFGSWVDASGAQHSNAAVADPADSSTGNIGYGVSVDGNSVLDAGSGTVSIFGASSIENVAGVIIGAATISGSDITIGGYETFPTESSDDITTGVLLSNAVLQATHSIDIQGNGVGAEGLSSYSTQLSVTPADTDTTAFLSAKGFSSGAIGADITATSMTVANGATLTVSGTTTDGGYTALALENADAGVGMILDASSAGGAITVTAAGGAGFVMDSATVLASAAGVTFDATNSISTISNSDIESDGTVALTSDQLSFTSSSATANAAGVAIIASNGSAGLSSLAIGEGSLDFSTPNGRWIVWLTDLAARPSALPTNYDYQRFGVTGPADWAGDTGNGIVYTQTENVTVTGTVTSRAYDGGLDAQTGPLSATIGDGLGFAYVNSSAFAQFDDKNAGTDKSVSVLSNQAGASPVTVTDSLENRPIYGVTVVSQLSGTITPRDLTGTLTIDKVYDGSALYAGAAVTGLDNLVGDETVVVTASGSFADKNVGQNRPVSASYQLADGTNGGLASNYTFTGSENPTGTITPLAIDLTGLAAANKIYDATRVATATGTASVTPLSGDTLTVVGTPQLAFADKNVGNGKAVSVSGLSLGGTDAGNYTLVTDGLITANITPASLSLSGLTAMNKVYDTTTTATLAGTAAVTPLGEDQVTVSSGQGAFADKNVGQAKTVTLSGFALGGADAGNYTLQTGTLSADITPATLVLNGLTAQNKVYDATTSATLAGTAAVTPLGSDQVTVSGGQGAFADKNVGQAKPVTLSGFSLAGADAGNYTLQLGTLSADITPATLTYVAAPVSLFEGQTLPLLTGSVTGLIGADTLANATTGTAAFDTPAGENSVTSPNGVITAPPGRYAIDGSGLAATNYVFVQDAGNAQALTVSFPPQSQTESPAGQQSVVSTQRAEASQQAHPDAGKGSVIDTTGLYPVGNATPLFGAMPLSDMSPDALVALLGARDDFMQALLSGSLGQLAVQPGLADLPPCQSLKEAAAGTCLVTEQLRTEARASGATSSDAAAPTPAPTATVPADATAAQPAPVPAKTAPSPTSVATNPAPPAFTPLFSYRPIKSATLPQIQHKVAVLIGVDDYRDEGIPHLTHAVGDAQAMAELFAQRLGYETLTLANPTRGQVVATLNRLALEMGPRDSVLIYYAGHGAVVDGEGAGKGEGYWLLADSQAPKPETWLSNADIARLLGVIDADQVALISDSCYSGKLASGARIQVAPDLTDPGKILSRRAEVVMSSGGNEPVFDAGKHGHSPFAWNLMDTLDKTTGWTPGGRIFERVRYAVARELPQHPQYAGATHHQSDADYLFEQRQLGGTN